jgi:nucleoside-diphosphate-sugar epimerase
MSLITVLGGSGFVGSAIIRRLEHAKLDHVAPGKNETLTGKNLGDIIYCVGLTADFRSRPLETVDAHVCHLMQIVRNCHFRSLVYLSSTRIYRKQSGAAHEGDTLSVNPSDGDDLYNISKIMGEATAMAVGHKVKIVRLSNVYGPDFTSANFLSAILKDVVQGKQVTVQSSPDSEKDYISLNDVVDGLLRIALEGRHQIYNLASGKNVANSQLADELKRLTGQQLRFDPTAAKTISPLIKIDRMQEEFNFRPTNIIDDLSKLIESYKAQFATGG